MTSPHREHLELDHLDHPERLDDPEPFVADQAFRDAVLARGGSLQRRRRHRIFGMTAAVLVLSVLGAGAGFVAYERHKVRQIQRIDLAGSLDDPNAVPTGPGAGDPPVGDPGESEGTPPKVVMNVLLVGSDGGMPGPGRDPALANTDTMMIVRIDPSAHRVNVLSLQRDLWVEIPGHGRERLNSAWASGDARLLIETIRANYEIPIHHFVHIDGEGFRRLVDQVGGTSLYASGHLRDLTTGFAVDAGCVHLDGSAALALVRSRHLSFRTSSGQWIEDPASDLGRIQRQQLVLHTLASSLLAQSPTPGVIDGLVSTLVDTATIDSGWSNRDLAGVISWARRLDLDRELSMAQLPVIAGYEGAAAVLRLDQAAAEPVLAPFRAPSSAATTTTPPVTTAGVPGIPGASGAPGAPGAAETPAAPPTDPPREVTTTAPPPPGDSRAPGGWITATKPDGTRCA